MTEVYTSSDSIYKARDAAYQYYDYGPLARVETGEYQVQGTDYAYTINGWLKGANSNTLDPNRDMGKDGTKGYYANNLAVHRHFAKDAFGFTLNYFEGDYRAIGTNNFEAHYSNTPFGNASANLYNGNIRHMVTAIEGMEIQGYAYTYDQLQRLNTMKVFRSEYLIEDNDWKGAKLTDDYFTRINYDKNGNILTLQRNGYKGAQLEMDRFEYFYETIGGNPSNRLNGVKDSAPNYAGYDDIKDGSAYKYNRLGELVYDDTEAMKLEWRYGDHKLKNIERLDQNSPNVEFIYNPLGVRVAKIIKPRSGGVVLEGEKWKVTYYSYDANGQLMATYNSDLYNGTIKETKLEEQYIYGSKRVGVIKANKVLYDEGPVQASTSPIKDNFLGKKRYELTNHLGNVLATITDRKTYNPIDGYYEPVITMKADYYAFGMLMPGRNEGISDARHLFNGMEHDMEVSGNGNSYTTEFRQYDPRLGRWKSLDPLMAKYPEMSPYVAFNNNPIYFTDPFGLEGKGGPGFGKKKHGKITGIRGNGFLKGFFSKIGTAVSNINFKSKGGNGVPGNIRWKGLGNIGRRIEMAPPAGRMKNQGWYHNSPNYEDWFSGSVSTQGDPIDTKFGAPHHSHMSERYGTSNVTITGLDVRGEAPAGTFFRATGGMSRAHQGPLFATNGIQNLLSPSTIARSSGAEDGNSAVPRNYFEARSGFLPLLNLLPDISANRVPIGTALFENPTGFMYGAFIANMLWTFNVFNHKPVFRGDVWTLEFSAYGAQKGTVDFNYNIKVKAWEEWTNKPFIIDIWHWIMWGGKY